MVLLEPLMVKTYEGSGEPTLSPPDGHSYRIVDYMQDDGDVEFSELLIDRMSVLNFKVNHTRFNQVFDYGITDVTKTLLQRLREKGIWAGLPIAHGQTFTAKPGFTAAKELIIAYEDWEEGDITSDMENGTTAPSYLYINYGTNSAAFANGAYGDLDKCILPAEYPDFPFGEVVPAGVEIDVLGFTTINYQRNGTTFMLCKFFRAISEREVLFDRDRVGVWIRSGREYWPWKEVRLLPAPRTFRAGEELILSYRNDSGASIPAEVALAGIIQRVRKV